MTHDLDLAGERVTLRADRTLAWPRRRTLLLADPHFGKATAFRRAGLPVPDADEDALTRLDAALRETNAERLVVLGDFWHARAGRGERVVERLSQWRSRHESLALVLARGNHDAAGAPPPGWGDWHAGDLADPPFVFSHYPDPSESGYVLAGHVHPGIVLRGPGGERLRLPCFRIGPHALTLPAYGLFTGLAIRPGPGERSYAVAGGEIVAV